MVYAKFTKVIELHIVSYLSIVNYSLQTVNYTSSIVSTVFMHCKHFFLDSTLSQQEKMKPVKVS